MECSDKVVFPLSVSLEIRISNLPLPPVFILCPERTFNTPVHCTALEFTAEEDSIFIPQWIFKQLGYKSINNTGKRCKTGYGINIYAAAYKSNPPGYLLPRCSYIKVHYIENFDSWEVKKAIKNYTVIVESSDLIIKNKSNLLTLKILKVLPSEICLISNDFDLEVSSKAIKEKPEVFPVIQESNKLLALESLPEWPEKCPKFLVDIMSKSPAHKTDLASKQRSRTHQTTLSLFNSLHFNKDTIPRRLKLPKGLKAFRPPISPATHLKSNEQSASPKVVKFNLPVISATNHSSLALSGPIGAERWFKRRPKKTPEPLPFEVFSQPPSLS